MMLENEEVEKFEFGSHNFYAPRLEAGKFVGFFPWQEFFRAQGFQDRYPYVLYLSQEADRLFGVVSSLVASAVSSNAWTAEVALEFVDMPPQIYPEGRLQISFYETDLLDLADLAPEVWRRCMALAVLRYLLSEEGYGSRIDSRCLVGTDPVSGLPLEDPETESFAFRWCKIAE